MYYYSYCTTNMSIEIFDCAHWLAVRFLTLYHSLKEQRFVHYTNVIRFLTYYVHIMKYLTDTKNKHNPNQTALVQAYDKGTPCDVCMTKGPKEKIK